MKITIGKNNDNNHQRFLIIGFGRPKSLFLAPKNGHFKQFWVQKMGLQMPEIKNGDHFLSQIIPKSGGYSCFM